MMPQQKPVLFTVVLLILYIHCQADKNDAIRKGKSVCTVRKTFVTAKFHNCLPRKVPLSVCVGSCISLDNWKTARPCTCCRPMHTVWLPVDLKCYQNNKALVIERHRVKEIKACSCTPCFDTI